MDKRFESVLRMKDGLGDSSYARNSTLQGNALECIEHDLEETIWRTAIHGYPTIRIADLGSSSGHNAVNAAKTIIKAFKNKVLSSHGSIPMPELQIFFNDLPSNDFNTLFNIISDDRSEENIVKGSGIFVGGIPGSFYRRLFPANSLHFVFSAFALQWLSQVPEGVTDKKCIAWNGGNVHVSNPPVAEAYSQQFQTDFAHFLSLRGPEVVSGGRMFLIFAGRESIDPTQQGRGEIIAKLIQLAFSDIIFQGMANLEKLDSFNLPIFLPCIDELKIIVEKDNYFEFQNGNFVNNFQQWKMNMNSTEKKETSKIISRNLKATFESVIELHLGKEASEKLFEMLENRAQENYEEVVNGWANGGFVFVELMHK